MRVDIKRVKFYKEVVSLGLEDLFDSNTRGIINNVDTLYYSVSLAGDSVLNPSSSILEFVEELEMFKDLVREKKKSVWYDFDSKLIFTKFSFQNYSYNISLKDYFDIFVCRRLPNEATPRIFVQLRSVGLWQMGVNELVQYSFSVLKSILSVFKIDVLHCLENRIDYCFHTNMISSGMSYFSDKFINLHLKTRLTKCFRVADVVSDSLEESMVSFGRKTSNNVYLRMYDKTKEVIQQGYKGYFFDIWLENKLISYYDYYCYNYAYSLKDYQKVYEGMLHFYLEFGSDLQLKERISFVLDGSYASDYIKKFALSFMPKLNVVLNFEFQTMRKFYSSSDSIIDTLPISSECDFELLRIFRILCNSKIFLNYLFSSTLSFLKDKSKPFSKENCCDFWYRLYTVSIKSCCDFKLVREYYNSSIEQTKLLNRIKKDVSKISVLNSNLNTDFDFDLGFTINALNDNDLLSRSYDVIKGDVLKDFSYKNKNIPSMPRNVSLSE